MHLLLWLLIFSLVVTYPLKKFIKMIYEKIGFKHKQLFISTYITSVLLSAIYFLIVHGTTSNALIYFVFFTISLTYWLVLDFKSSDLSSKFIRFLENSCV